MNNNFKVGDLVIVLKPTEKDKQRYSETISWLDKDMGEYVGKICRIVRILDSTSYGPTYTLTPLHLDTGKHLQSNYNFLEESIIPVINSLKDKKDREDAVNLLRL